MTTLRWCLAVCVLVLASVTVHAETLPPNYVTDPAELTADHVLQLPEGVIKLSEFSVPKGAVVIGKGFDKTIVDAEGKDVAFVVDGVSGVEISNLTIRNAGSAGIRVNNASNVSIVRVRVTGPVVGIGVSDSSKVYITSCIISHGNAGISFKNVSGSTVRNNTIARLGSTCMGLSDVTDTVVFNNIFADASTALVVSGQRTGLVIDYNLHACFAAGKIDSQLARAYLPPWQTVSGFDQHSVATGVVFKDPDNGNFTPISMLSWQPGVATTSRWGIQALAGREAATWDITVKSRFWRADDDGVRVDLGAIVVPRNEKTYAADGQFTILSDAGTKSAGVFTKDGRLIRYLFHDLPLAKGTYDFHLPGQTQLGAAIPAGEYEVRVVEANIDVEYRGFTGNLGAGNTVLDSNSLHLSYIGWSGDGQLLLGNDWSEKAMNLVKVDPATGKGLWGFKGSSGQFGVTADGKGTVYLIRRTSDWSKPANFQITRLDEKTGQPILDEHNNAGATFDDLTKSIRIGGAAFLNGVIYICDPDANQLLAIDVATMKALPPVELPNLDGNSIAADAKRGLLWTVAKHRDGVIAIKPDGTIEHRHLLVKNALAVAVAGDQLAVADANSGKVFIYDISDPAKPVQKRQIGTGDGPYGPWQADRFTFQVGLYNQTPYARLAMKPDGSLAVMGPAFGQLSVFDAKGKPVYHAMGTFGNGPTLPNWNGHAPTGVTTDRVVFFENSGQMSYWVDTAKNTTGMDAFWGIPPTCRNIGDLIGAFESDGKRFGVFRYKAPADGRTGVMVCRYDGYVAVPVSLYLQAGGGDGGWVVRHDPSGKGVIDPNSKDGTPIAFPGQPLMRWMVTNPSGDIFTIGTMSPPQLAMRWKFKGLDDKGVPIYDVGPDLALKRKDQAITNPYDFDKTTGISQSDTWEMPDGQGTAVGAVISDTIQGTGFSNSGGTDLARFAPDGELLWFRPMNEVAPVYGAKPLGKYMMTTYGHEAWWMMVTNDGLGMGQFGTPAAYNWCGAWIDHPDTPIAFIGKDGRTHLITGDYFNTMVHWMTLTGEDTVKHAAYPLTIDDAKAAQLAARPKQPYQPTAKPQPSEVIVKKLDKPLPMDGDLAKWRTAVPAPQILVTPATATGGINSPTDLSAVIRIAYHGDTLFFQLLVFDDVIAQHQPWNKFHQQDSFQMTFNGFLQGFAFSGATLADGTEFLFRNRFFLTKMDLWLDKDLAPRKYRVLDNARDVTERKYIESIYGEDMSACKVRLYEFAIPVNEKTYSYDGVVDPALERMKMKSGLKFWIGFMLNDVDTIGVDAQPYAVWPSTYGMFATEDKGATAVLE